MRIAVIGGGSAGCLAAAQVSHSAPDHELHHIHDSRIPPIGVGEGTLIGLAMKLRSLTGLDDSGVRRRLKATRKYGIHYQGWGRANPGFIHHFLPVDRAYGYHLSADALAEMLSAHIRARRVDARVTTLTRVQNGTQIEFDSLPSERFDFVIDARGFPRQLDPQQHIEIPFIPTNTAIIRRGPVTVVDPSHSYTRAVARPHGWIFVIPLAAHTSYGYIFNRDITSIEETEQDFDTFLEKDDVPTFSRRGVIPFPNFIHRRIYDGYLARIGNAAGFMEPLEASSLTLTQIQIDTILNTQLSGSAERLETYAGLVNQLLVRFAWRLGVFISWHYSLGSVYDSEFWRYAREQAWPRHLDRVLDSTIDSAAESRLFEALVERTTRQVGQKKSDHSPKKYAAFSLQNIRNVAGGLGYIDDGPEPAWWLPKAP